MNELLVFYVSLVRGLQGCYVKFLAKDYYDVCKWCSVFMSRIWCDAYEEDDFKYRIVPQLNGKCINEDDPIDLSQQRFWRK